MYDVQHHFSTFAPMIHYHGLPITPATAAATAVGAGHAFVSYAHADQLGVAVAVCQSFAIDNGAFSAWKSGCPVEDWSSFYEWAENCRRIPSCDFAVIPDVIDGDEEANDKLLDEWPLPIWFGAPVWHMHESFDRLRRLSDKYPRICIGSSRRYATVGNEIWWRRMDKAMEAICTPDGRPLCKLHGLRMLNPKIFTKFPFSSVDSTNIGRNVGIDKHWAKGNYLPPTKEMRAQVMRARIEAHNAPAIYTFEDL
jgi:hypothetical protein